MRLGAFVKEVGIDESGGDERLQILRRASLHAGGDFLGKDFEEKLRHSIGSSAGEQANRVSMSGGVASPLIAQ
jgi:hypothetical protein